MRTSLAIISLVVLPFFTVAVECVAQEPGLFRYPAVSRDHVAFVYDDDVWILQRGATNARRLSTISGRKRDLRFSPDGSQVAFTANAEGNSANIFTVRIEGGATHQITHLPYAQLLTQWTNDDRLLFYTNSLSFTQIEMQMFTVSAKGGLPQRLPVAYGAEGALDDTGARLAYTPHWRTPLTRTWKRYRGGAAQDVWLFDLRTRESKRITEWIGTDSRPMWRGNTVVYVSDAGAGSRLNLWSFDTGTSIRTQLTKFRDYDVQNPSIGPGRNGEGEIVFQYGADLLSLNLATMQTSTISVDIPARERPVLRRDVDAARFIAHRELSPDGSRVLMEARGDLWLQSIDAGNAVNITETSDVFEREASWSPDGTSIAYSSDASGEYEFYIRPSGPGAARQLTHFKGGFRYRPVWSPDSKRLAFTDHSGGFFTCDIVDGHVTEVDRDAWGAQEPDIAWSWDSRLLAYTKTDASRLTSIWIYSVTDGSKTRVTSGRYNDSAPAFDRRGQHLYFVSDRSFATATLDPLLSTVAYNAQSVVMSASITEGLERAEGLATPIPATRGRIVRLEVTNDDAPIYSIVTPGGDRSVRIVRGGAEIVVLEGTSTFQLSADGRKLLVTRADHSFVTDPLTRPAKETAIPNGEMKVNVDLRAEWRQIFADLWRLYRDFFYDPTMHGVNWSAVRTAYAPLIERAATRDDVNYILGEMIGELSVGHAYIVNEGDVVRQPVHAVGMLGVDFVSEHGAYRIAKIYEGFPVDVASRSPLRQRSEDEVRIGEYLLAVNGRTVDVAVDPWSAFDGLADQEVTITVGPHPSRDSSARDVKVKPVVNESNLRYRSWVEENRRLVEEKSGGRAGYLHVPDFTSNGLAEFVRQLEWQTDKDALVMDARWSQGGSQGATIAELLARRPLNYAADRYGSQVWPAPRRGAQFGPKAVVVNHLVHSAGENFLYYFRKLETGTIVGTRTWGGLVGLNGNPGLIDNGYVNIPNAAFFDRQGWIIEGHGVDPDVVVEDDRARAAGTLDPQITRALAVVLDQIRSDGYRAPARPRYKGCRRIRNHDCE